MFLRSVCLSLLVIVVVGCAMDEPASPTARFNVLNDGCIAPCRVNFEDKSENKSVYRWTYAWSMDGGAVFSTEESPSYQFESAGVHKVLLTISNDKYGSHTYEDNVSITAPVVKPIASFTYMVKDSIRKDSVVIGFSNTSKNAKTYSWDFGDKSAKSKLTEPVHSYVRAAKDTSYTVWLMAITDNIKDSTAKQILIRKK